MATVPITIEVDEETAKNTPQSRSMNVGKFSFF